MRIASIVAGLAICLTVGLVSAHQKDQPPTQQTAAQVASPQAPAPGHLSVFAPEAEQLAKKCSFNSDCPYGKCKGGKCGACSFNSDCKGWGKCSKGQCGACSFNSECKGFGKCSGGKCTKSPY